MRLIFAGTPAFAAVALDRLVAAGHDIALVLSQPDRPAGRGMALQQSEVKQVALRHGLPVYQPTTLKDDAAVERLRTAEAPLMVVAAYGLILPQRVLDLFPRGCINIHASLLPRWRGAAPIHRAIEAGDAQTGISIMRMEAGLDTGPVYLTRAIPIAPADTTRTLHDKLAALGGESICEALQWLERGEPTPTPQPTNGVTYAKKIAKSEAPLDWRRSALELERQVRAFDPFPIATATLRGEAIRVWRASVLPAEPTPGSGGAPVGEVVRVDDSGIAVRCAGGILRLEELQRPGGKRVAAADFLRGVAVRQGERLASDA